MEIPPLSISLQPRNENTKRELIILNSKTESQGLSLTEAQMTMLVERRTEALRETKRIEFGRGPLPELVDAFFRSPYLHQESYAETMVGLQDLFYRLKEETREEVSDEDLIEVMRSIFDNEAHGALEYFEGLSAEKLVAAAKSNGNDAYENWSEEEAYGSDDAYETNASGLRREKGNDKEECEAAPDETDRIFEGSRTDRPDNDYANGFYDSYNELYRVGFDYNSRIGGSSL